MSNTIKKYLFGFFVIAVAVIICVACSGCKQSQNIDRKIKVDSLKGPTSVGIAKIIKEKSDTYDFKIVAQADAIVSDIASGNVDISLLPANVASTVYNKTHGQIKVIDINTLGVLHCVSQDANIKSITDLKGKTVYMTGKGTIPQCTMDILLKANNMSEADLKLEFKNEASEIISLIGKDPGAVGVINEPQATIALNKNPKLAKVIDLTDA